MSIDSKTIRAVIRGRVQGVSYRAWTKKQADRHSVAGWVRNRPDRTVEALFSGPAEAVETLLAACRRGPFAARVDGIEVSEADAFEGQGFEIRS
ncbi:acylphosphatase [Methylorubrum populi]|uniref:acylphosphatase n=1 Tax=Methylorubrum populi TaxID=223967 RepID=A0A514KPS7_9HYPH|nr:acylphosphatase [Methylorubrum populi]KAB7784974.1 putative Acylphosphate phosphohydrolase [Methylorubrum populi]QDI81584.1 acylphosphatase [Methylorubrum populi]